MEGLIEDASNIRNVLPWIESEEEILFFLKNIPPDHFHLRIPLALSHFLNIRDQNEENTELNIERDARNIVVLLPDTPYILIKNCLRELGNISNRKEVVVKQFLNKRPELKNVLAELNIHNSNEKLDVNIRKRNNPVDPEHNKLDSDITQIKIRKVEGSIQEVSNIGQAPDIRNIPCSSTTSDCSKTNPVVMNNEILQTYNLIDNLREVSHAAEDTVKKICTEMNVSTNEKPDVTVLNKILNKIYDESIIEVDDNDSSTTVLSDFSAINSDTESLPEIPKDYSTKDNNRPLIKPATLVFNSENKPSPSTSTHSTTPYQYNRTPVPAMPQEYLDRIAPNNEIIKKNDDTEIRNVPIDEETKNYDEKLVLRLIEIFPDSCPKYLREICDGKEWEDLDDIVTVILSKEHPKRPQRIPSPVKEVDVEEQLEIVKALLPDADPTYLRWKCESIGNDADELNAFVNEAREKKNYPTMKEYLRKQKFTAQSKQYTTDFNPDSFVELFPEPEKTFRDPKRTVSVDNYAALYICNFFQTRYDRLPLKTIRSILASNDYRISISDDEMSRRTERGPLLKSRRKPNGLKDPPQNIAVLQELAYLTHKRDVDDYIMEKKRSEERERDAAKERGLMETCRCCFDDEVMPNNCFGCPAGCTFCGDCIRRSCEVALGDGKTEFRCLDNCREEFSLQVLQKVLPPKMFSKLAQKKSLAEVKAAGIEELEFCPFCDFASIPVENDKIFRCLNPDCMKESCRLCKEENHVPYKCDELEKDEDVRARIFVENQMTEALLCKCYKCGTSFFKEEGCNKMTCTCGANMCYVCKQPVKDYKHFNGIGGTEFHLCPLYSDTNEINKRNVSLAAEQAKSKIDPAKLKVDPALDVTEHYEKRKKELPVEPYLELLNQQMQLHYLQGQRGGRRRQQHFHHHHHHHHHQHP
ncbi:uncharacterized protein LOC130448505 [Diorhabda sublineata]|uniref:uncharacterized protein LOC130448505 n=1 Tax=Diorhabda sublineata TaxID=1163346 RepID=UPI0024E0BC97|nr:uncharacterized protein LOC130448505 [Diorhabda sublineata]